VLIKMNKLTAILVDDEESARDVLANLLLRFCPEVELLAKCENIPQAVDEIKHHKPDFVFLDIEMPKYAGFEIVKFFDQVDFDIIFVTAYDRYAVRAFEVAAVDYLLKPIDIARLKDAVSRVKKRADGKNHTNQLNVLTQTLESKSVKNIMVTDKGEQFVVPVESIVAIEAQESYCQIYTTSRKYLVSKNLKHFETVLEENKLFFRTHKSWLINRSFLLHYSKSNFTITLANNVSAKLSKYKKEEFEKALLT